MYKKLSLLVVLSIFILLITACEKGPTPLKEFLQEITVTNPVRTMKPNETLTMAITVKNITKEKWFRFANKYHVSLNCYWIDDTGKSIIGPGSYLPHDLTPGESVTLNVSITSPSKPSKYILRFSMVQQDVEYFEKKGAKPLDIPVNVTIK